MSHSSRILPLLRSGQEKRTFAAELKLILLTGM